MEVINILQMPLFKRAYKKLHPNQKKFVDEAVEVIKQDPFNGEVKKGDLKKVFVYKFPCLNQQFLLAYKFDNKNRVLLYVGVHENFYRILKN